MTSPGDIALTVPCTICGAGEDVRCVYVWPKGVAECEFAPDSDVCYKHSQGQHERLAKVGTHTKTSHAGRKNAVFKRTTRERQIQEWEELRRWFLKYGDIFEIK